jgi:hypothetical protein
VALLAITLSFVLGCAERQSDTMIPWACDIQCEGDARTRDEGIDVEEPPPPVLVGRRLTDGCSLEPYEEEIRAENGAGLTWTFGDGTRPLGLDLSGRAATASLVGRPTNSGEFAFGVVATDRLGRAAEAQFLLTIFECDPPLSVSEVVLADATIGIPYEATIEAMGGAKPYQWRLIVGELPDGLELRTVNSEARITGVPRAAGTFVFRVEVTDAKEARRRSAFFIAVQSS